MALNKFVMVKFLNDSIVDPVDSEVRPKATVPRDCRKLTIPPAAASWTNLSSPPTLHLGKHHLQSFSQTQNFMQTMWLHSIVLISGSLSQKRFRITSPFFINPKLDIQVCLDSEGSIFPASSPIFWYLKCPKSVRRLLSHALVFWMLSPGFSPWQTPVKAKYNATSSRTPPLPPEFGSLLVVVSSVCSSSWPWTWSDPLGWQMWGTTSCFCFWSHQPQLKLCSVSDHKSHHIFEWPLSSESLYIFWEKNQNILWYENHISKCISLENPCSFLTLACSLCVTTVSSHHDMILYLAFIEVCWPTSKQWIGSVPARLAASWEKGLYIYPWMTRAAQGLSFAVREGSTSYGERENWRLLVHLSGLTFNMRWLKIHLYVTYYGTCL